MTNSEINVAINKYRGVKSHHGDTHALTAISYFFLMDASYDVFNKKIRTLPLKHDKKRMRSYLLSAYNAFFDNFFAAFNQDQRDFLIDKADAMESFIEPHLQIAHIAMMECCNDEPIETQEKIADFWLCNRLALEARDFYSRSWKKDGFLLRGALYTKSDTDPNITAVLKRSFDLSVALFGEGGDVTDKHLQRINMAASILTKKIAEWINEDYKNDISSHF